MSYKRIQPPIPDSEPKHTCPNFDAAISEIEKARAANSLLRAIISQWRRQAEYWEVRCEDLTSELEEKGNKNDELFEKIKDLTSELREKENEVNKLEGKLNAFSN